MTNPHPNIWKLQAEKDIDGLIEALHSPEPDIRRRTAAALRVLGSTKAIFALTRALAHEQDADVREHMAAALEHLDRDEIINNLIAEKNVQRLTEILNSPYADDVLRAIEALGNIGDRLATEGLVMVFRNATMPDEIRLAAAEALLKLESAPAVVTLLGALRKDNWKIRHNAAAVLGQLRATWATKPLIDALKDENTTVRKTAAAALRRFNTPQALQALAYFKIEERGKTGPLTPLPKTQPLSPPPTPSISEGWGKVIIENESDANDQTITHIARPKGLTEALQNALAATTKSEPPPASPPAGTSPHPQPPKTSRNQAESTRDPQPKTEIDGDADHTSVTLHKRPPGWEEALQQIRPEPSTPSTDFPTSEPPPEK